MKSKINSPIEADQKSRVWVGASLLLVLVLVTYFTLAPGFPVRVTPANAPAEQFSAARAGVLLSNITEPHPQGSPAQARLRDILFSELTRMGLEVEVQRTRGLENVVARLRGSDPTGAILILAHYDSSTSGPGAADNGSGVAALLEIMRALAAGPGTRNDIIALFDDGEEMPDALAGTKAFVAEHRWMADVRVAIGMDTAVRGPISTDDTGPENGWMVGVLSQAYTGGAWNSVSGGGQYDSKPFRDAGIRVLELEDNYPFHEQHTPDDLPAIVRPGTLQQLGEQALSVARVLGGLDLGMTSGPQQAFASLPFVGFIHYPESWSVFLAILAGITLVAAFVLTLLRKLVTWRGLGVAVLTFLLTCAVSAVGVNALWKAAPRLLGWETGNWSDWPEVIPPHGWLILILSNLVVLGLVAVVYRLARRWSRHTDFSMVGMFLLFLIALACSLAVPQAAILPVWPVLIGSAGWILAVLLRKDGRAWLTDLLALPAAMTVIMFILPLIPGTFMGDGTKSVAILSGVWVLLLVVILPAVDGLLVRRVAFTK